MKNSNRRSRLAFFGALLAFVLASVILADAARPEHAEAKPVDLGVQIQGLVAGSEVRVLVFDADMANLNWAGKVSGPSGAEWAFSGWNSAGFWTKVATLKDIDAGEYTVEPANPIAAGWEVYGYRAVPSLDMLDCTFEPLEYTDSNTIQVSAAEPMWTVCVGVKVAGGLTGSKLAVKFVGPQVPGPWNGTLAIPGGSVPLNHLISDGSITGHWWNGKPGKYTVDPTSQPKSGLYTYGFYTMDLDYPVPTCPSDPSLYTSGNYAVTISELSPKKAICVMVVDNFDGKITLKVDGPSGVPWAGKVSTPGGFNSTWVAWGIDPASTIGTKDGLLPGQYGFYGAKPVAPGWSLVGLAAFESSAIDPACPGEIGAYRIADLAFVAPATPAWAVCAKVAPLEALPGTKLGLNIMSASRDGIVDGPVNYDFDFESIGIIIASSSGGRYDIPVGSYKILPEAPAGTAPVFHALESELYDCPSDLGLYSADAHTVEVSAQEPIWLVCVRFVALPDPEPEPDQPPVQDPPAQDPPEDDPAPADPPAQEPDGDTQTGLPTQDPTFPSSNPDPGIASNPEPEPSPVAPAATPSNPGPPVAKPTPAAPGGTDDPAPSPDPAAPVASDSPAAEPASSNPSGVLSANPTPIAPSTGNGMAGAAGPSTIMFGLILVAFATAAVAAGWLPSRRKR